MTNPNSPIPLNDLPHLKAEKPKSPDDYEENATYESKSRSKSAIWPAITVLILCIVGVSFWNNLLTNQLHAQKQQTQSALDRITALEQRLSSTDENVSQSSISVQVRLKELKQRSDELWDQMDKLWASAWRRNQKDLSDQSKSLDKLKQSFAKAESNQSQHIKQVKSLQTDIALLQVKIEELAFLNQGIEKNNKAVAGLKQSLNKLQADSQKLQKSVNDNTGWVESNLTFRKQTNQQFDKLDKRLKKLEPVS